MAWHKTGSISATNGSAVVYGAGTAWVDAGVLNAGDIITINGTLYEILSIQSNTQLTLASNYLGATAAGLGYAIMPIGLLPSALAQQVKTTLATANAALSAAVRSDVQNLTAAQQQTARNNIAALGAADVGAGRLVKSVAGGVDVVLTAAEASAQFMEFTGTLTANINVIVPATVRLYYVVNGTAGAYTLTVKTAGGSGVAVAQGKTQPLYCDSAAVRVAGVDVVALAQDVALKAPAASPVFTGTVFAENIAWTADRQFIGRTFGRLSTSPGQGLGNDSLAGRYGLALTYNVRPAQGGGYESIGGGQAGALTTDEGRLSWSRGTPTSDAGQPVTFTTELYVSAAGNTVLGSVADDGDKLQVSGIATAAGFRHRSYTRATVPAATAYARCTVYVSDAVGGASLAWSDGAGWTSFKTNAAI